MSSRSWEELSAGPNGPIVRDLRGVIRSGLSRVDVSDLEVLPTLFGGPSGPADAQTIRERLLGLLMAGDPFASPRDDPSTLTPATNLRLCLFRAAGVLREATIAQARAAAGHYGRGARPISPDG